MAAVIRTGAKTPPPQSLLEAVDALLSPLRGRRGRLPEVNEAMTLQDFAECALMSSTLSEGERVLATAVVALVAEPHGPGRIDEVRRARDSL